MMLMVRLASAVPWMLGKINVPRPTTGTGWLSYTTSSAVDETPMAMVCAEVVLSGEVGMTSEIKSVFVVPIPRRRVVFQMTPMVHLCAYMSCKAWLAKRSAGHHPSSVAFDANMRVAPPSPPLWRCVCE